MIGTSNAHNVVGNPSGSSGLDPADITNAIAHNVIDTILADNGGPTQTHALVPGGPAVDFGDNTVVTVTTDLDGNPRITDGDHDGTATVDMGAYENTPSIPTISSWGMLALMLCVLVAATIVIRRRAVDTVRRIAA